ncbi:hypothetical protein G3I44_13495 [Halogeometricum borinquense]|uniref:Ribbon-helix-helix protein, CopG family n=1 Tax=Halogeometricum borinquense TaxID=60847 RepID=A0A6C0UJ16_9EURY|nr:hypothetical protein [Halogeometricum borinquense]QIB75207.1 hypothetical protein G3I44_13495 [Halogeometricum borinquense]
MADKQLVQLKVASDRLDAWDAWVEESNKVDTRSRLIRAAVEEYIQEGEETEGFSDDAVARVLGRIEDLEKELDAHDDRLMAHRSYSVDSDEMESILERLVVTRAAGAVENRIDELLTDEDYIDREELIEEIVEGVAEEVSGGGERGY